MTVHFNIRDIPPIIIENMLEKSVWQKGCPITIDRLKLVDIKHYDFFEKITSGQIIVLDKIANSVVKIFEELFALKFPIHSVKTIEEFGGNDYLSMEENNSSCFNFRNIPSVGIISIHSYGAAIDINPVQNPFIIIEKDVVTVFPKQSVEFLNRNNQRKGMVEPIVPIFEKYGFEWGGFWNTPIDYHHFQIPRNKIEELVKS
jgi:hypothetical protein